MYAFELPLHGCELAAQFGELPVHKDELLAEVISSYIYVRGFFLSKCETKPLFIFIFNRMVLLNV